MRIHRTEVASHFTQLPNRVVQNRRLSYTARGLLVDLLSRPDGWREDGRQMADTSPQGRGAIRRALKELTAAGFYRVEKIRLPDGTIRTVTHVYDTPQLVPPGVTRPDAGEPPTGRADTLLKDLDKEPTSPAEQAPEPAAAAERPTRRRRREAAVRPPVEPADEQTREAVATLFRVIRPEPRLRLGEAEARELAPLVAQWLDRGSTPADLARALLPGLPAPMHSAAAVLRYRLERGMPPAQEPAPPAVPRYAECVGCHDPVPRPGLCHPCAGGPARTVSIGHGADVAAAGAARVRAALHSALAAGRRAAPPLRPRPPRTLAACAAGAT
ncbi:hypothetical protein GCM10010440_04260 [Kitasatospora cinereorecta]